MPERYSLIEITNNPELFEVIKEGSKRFRETEFDNICNRIARELEISEESYFVPGSLDGKEKGRESFMLIIHGDEFIYLYQSDLKIRLREDLMTRFNEYCASNGPIFELDPGGDAYITALDKTIY